MSDQEQKIDLVQLDREHPGFRDREYRRRRNEIAEQALRWRPGTPIPEIVYTDEEREVWRVILEQLSVLHDRFACREYLESSQNIPWRKERISQLSEVNAILEKKTGFSMVPVAGLVTPGVFLRELGEHRFRSTQYMRHHSTPLYTPEPDVVHELIGHAALLTHPEFAALNQLFGEAAFCADAATEEALIRVYWYALEFGLTKEGGALKAVGAGLLSSFGELGRFSTHAELRPFDLSEMAATPFDPTDYQRVLFVAPDTQALTGSLRVWLEGLVGRRG